MTQFDSPSPFESFPPPPPPRASGLATAALVLGLLSLPTLCVCVGPLVGALAVVLGIVALVRAAGQPERFAGRGRAAAGIATGAGSIGLALLIALFMASSGGQFMPFVRSQINLMHIAQAWQQYHAIHAQPPPNLNALLDSGALAPDTLLGDPNEGLARFHYVADVRRSDPGKWIVAYAEVAIFQRSFVVLCRADGSWDTQPADVFQKTLSDFKQDYETRRGSPPHISTPAAAAEPQTRPSP